MAQLLLVGAQFACGLPAAKVVGPVVASMIPVSPLNLVVYCAWLLGLRLGKTQLSRRLGQTWRRAALWALALYFATMIPLYAIILLFVCRAVG